MPVITSTPVQVAPPPGSFRQFASEVNPFLFKVGTSLYQVLVSAQGTGPALLRVLGIFKSTDNGNTWTEMDSANSPDQGNQSGYGVSLISGGVITSAYLKTGQTVMLRCDFDTATDRWGTPSSAITVPFTLTTFCFLRRSDGTLVVVAGSNAHIYYFTSSGAGWSGITNLLGSGGQVFIGVIDSTDTIHLLLNTSAFSLSYRQVSAAFALGSATTIATSIPFTEGGHPSITLWGPDSVAIGYTGNSGADNKKAIVKIGTPLSAPVFTRYVIATATGPFLNENFTFITVEVGNAGDLNLFYVDLDLDQPIDQIMQSTFDGASTWSAPIIFYDAIADPPPNDVPDPNHQFLHTIDAVQLADGSWVIATTLETGPESAQFCTGFFLTTPVPGCPEIFIERQAQPAAPASALPPGVCEPFSPNMPVPTYVSYDEPLELQGS